MEIFLLGTRMEISVDIVNAAFAILLAGWLLIDILKRRRGGDCDLQIQHKVKQSAPLFHMISLLCNIIISILYLGFVFFEYLGLRVIASKSAYLSITWVLATLVACYSKGRVLRQNKRWPVVIVLWWLFYFIFGSLSVSIHFLTRFSSIEVPYPWPEPNLADFASLPLSILLCFSGLTFSCSTNSHNDLEEPLLQQQHESLLDSASYTNAGLWGQLTFQWLNPLFSRGQ